MRGGGEAGRGAMEEDRGSALAAESALEKNVAELTVMDVYDIEIGRAHV